MADIAITSNLPNTFLMEENKHAIDKAETVTDNLEARDSTILSENNPSTSTKLLQSSESETKCIENLELKKETETSQLGEENKSSDLPQEDEDEWLDIMGSGNFKKLVLVKGLGHDTRPDRGEKVTVNLKYFLNDVLIEQKENFQFIVGDLDVIQGLDLVVCLMEKNETARVKVPAKLAYGIIGRAPDIPPKSDLECEVQLLDVEVINEDKLTVTDRLQLGEEKRLRGNFFYERTDYIDAIHCYERAAEYLEGVKDSSGTSTEESQKVIDMIIKVNNNITASHLKLSAYQAALKSVESVLNIQPKNVKALYRKAKILGAQGSTDEAIKCLKIAAKLEPETKIIQTELVKLQNQKKKEEQSQKAMYRRMFPQSEPKKVSSFSKIMKISAVTAGCVAVVCGMGMAAYKQFHS